MRRLLALISVAGLAMALATSAQARPFTGTVSFGLSSLPPLVASGTGSGTSAPGLLTIATTAWAATGPTLITLNPTAAAPLTALNVLLTAPGPCTFTGIPARGPCALGGTANALVGYAPFLIVPLGNLGVAGRLNFGPYGSWIDAQSWKAATATPTVAGSPVLDDYGVPFYTVGYDARTPGGLGTVKLVAPAGLMSTLGGDLPLFVSMTLYVPEPGTLLALGFSGAGLMVAGGLSRWRRKGRTRKGRALFSLLVVLALGMVALWATSTLAGPFPPSSTTTTTTTTVPPQTPGECVRECRADEQDCRAAALEDKQQCSASCLNERASAFESCAALPSREMGECRRDAAAAAAVCSEVCRAARRGALDSCEAEFETCEADCTGDATP